MRQVKSLLSISAVLGLGLLSACSRYQIEPEDPTADPSVGTPPGTVVVEPVVIEPSPTPNTGDAPVVVTPPATPRAPDVNDGSTGIHVVQPSEGLYGIARQYGLDYRQLAAWNNISPPYTLQPGQQLVLSGSSDVVARTPVYTNPTPNPVTPPPTSPPVTGGVQYHTVQPGENLYRIAKSYGLNYQEVAQQNGIPYPYNVSIGQRISLFAGNTPSVAPRTPTYAPAPSTPGYHIVASQETLYSLSRRYGYSVQQLAAWNALYPPYTLRIGQSLRVSP